MLRLNCPYTFSQVPYIVNEVLDEYAEAVLLEAMPDAFCSPQPVDAERFLEFYLGLQVEYKKLSYNSKVLGLTAFNNGFIQVLNEQNGRPEPLYVKSGTVVVDTSLLHKRNEARLRFTLMHEGSHWLLHQRAFSKHNSFFSNEKYDNQYLAAKEGRIDYSRCQSERNDIERIERQADFLASALLIPRSPLRSVYRDFFRYFDEKPMRIVRGKDLCHDSYAIQLPQYVAQRFNVSKRAALIRLEKLGAIVDKQTAWSYRS